MSEARAGSPRFLARQRSRRLVTCQWPGPFAPHVPNYPCEDAKGKERACCFRCLFRSDIGGITLGMNLASCSPSVFPSPLTNSGLLPICTELLCVCWNKGESLNVGRGSCACIWPYLYRTKRGRAGHRCSVGTRGGAWGGMLGGKTAFPGASAMGKNAPPDAMVQMEAVREGKKPPPAASSSTQLLTRLASCEEMSAPVPAAKVSGGLPLKLVQSHCTS